MDTILHYIQDACELLAVYRLTNLAHKDGLSLKDDVTQKRNAYEKYCDERGIDMGKTRGSAEYKKMYDRHLPRFYKDIKKRYPKCKFDFVNVEVEYRNKKKKGDFLLIVKGRQNHEISFSLKAYKGGLSNIQLCSGTFNSFVCNFLFHPAGVGMFFTKNGDRFKGSNFVERNKQIKESGLTSVIPLLKKLDAIGPKIKQKYVRSEKAKQWKNIQSEWKADCCDMGHEAADICLDIMKCLSSSDIKNRLLEMIGFDGKEEMMFLSPDKYLNSLTDNNFKQLIHKIRHHSTQIKYRRSGKSLLFEFVEEKTGEVLLQVDVPFTLQKNGAWFLPKDKKDRYLLKEGMLLRYGQRRPKKSKELATSINTYARFGKTGLLSRDL